jgi:2-epi-valiolone-7-phosphate 1-reductase
MKSGGLHQALVRRGYSLQLETVPTTLPGPRDLLISLSFVGVCGTDLQILNGSRPDTATILGHEGIGVVERAGPEATLRAGETVVFNPVAELSAGRILGHNAPGLFQQRIAVDSTAVDQGLVMPISGAIPPLCGALVEPLAAVIYARELISRSTAELRSVVIFGAGPIGLLAAVYLSQCGIRTLIVHPSPVRLNTAIDRGLIAAHSTMIVSEDLVKRIVAYNDDCFVDAALICTTRRGAPAALQTALDITKDGGCVDIVTNYPETASAPYGVATDSIRNVRAANVCGTPDRGAYIYSVISGRRIAITGHRGTSAQHLRQAIRLLQFQKSPYAAVVTHVLTLDIAADAIQILADSNERILYNRDCIKAVIDLTCGPESA